MGSILLENVDCTRKINMTRSKEGIVGVLIDLAAIDSVRHIIDKDIKE